LDENHIIRTKGTRTAASAVSASLYPCRWGPASSGDPGLEKGCFHACSWKII